MTRPAAAVVRGAWVLAMAPGRELVRDGAVAIGGDGAIAAAVGPAEELAARFPERRGRRATATAIVLPGLVNAHTHLTRGPDPRHGRGLPAVGVVRADRRARAPTSPRARTCVVGTRLKGAEMLLSGITTVNDMSCHRNLGSLASLGAVDGLAELGMRGVVSLRRRGRLPRRARRRPPSWTSTRRSPTAAPASR